MAESKKLKKHPAPFIAIGAGLVVVGIAAEGVLKWPLIILGMAFSVYVLVVILREKQSKSE